MPKFRQKLVVIEAIQYTGENDEELITCFDELEDVDFYSKYFIFRTLEGSRYVYRGDWIIKEVDGSVSICNESVFEASYEQVPE
jgi:hypothetical protein